jgi:hypothetical protein
MKYLLPTRPRVATLAAAILLAACSSDNGVEPQPAPVSLDAALSEMTLPALSNAAASTGIAPVAVLTSASGCNYQAASGSFTCPTVNVAGLTLTRTFVLLDGAGNPQSSYDRTSTAAIRTTSSAVGTMTESGTTMHIDQQETMTLSGLLSGVHTLNGTSTMAMTGNDIGGRAENLTMSMTVTDVVLPNSATGSNAYPLSGTMTLVANDAVATLPATAFRFQITFNGTNTVPVTLSMDGLPSEHCTLDLSGHAAMSCS